MNEEEKQAIEKIKGLETLFEIDDKKDFEATPLVQKEIAKDLKILLNLIEKLQKENEELNGKILSNSGIYQVGFKDGEESYIKKVKDKIEEIDEELEIMKVDNMYSRYKEYGGKSKWERLFATKYGMHDALQELLEGRE